jgi:hypothetical protein
VKPTVVGDVECYHGFFFVALKRVSDGKLATFELSARKPIMDVGRLERILRSHRVVTFNGTVYDLPMIWLAVTGASNAELKAASDKIINGRLRWWDVGRALDIVIPRAIDHVDLIEPQPNAVASLKTLNGRLHGKRMQDLPIDPDAWPTDEEKDLLIDYCVNSDIPATELLLKTLKEPLELREALGAEYRQDFRSKSDSQMGEAIVKRRVEQITGKKIERVETPPGTSFRYKVPDFIKFKRPELRDLVKRLAETEFVVKADGKIGFPKWLDSLKVSIGSSTYAMGIGGLHSTEECRALHSDDDWVLVDADVASQYPSIILKVGLYPKALGPAFLTGYGEIKAERMTAKKAKNVAKDKGLKIALNGVYGKSNSRYSVLYAPHMMIAVTLTGQLSLLMLAEIAEAAGVPVVSGNTDGVVFRCPRSMYAGVDERNRLNMCALAGITAAWEQATGFDLEFAEYRSIYNANVNSYFAIKPDGSAKRKGALLSNPWAEGDLRGQMMKNPQMTVCSDAVLAFLQDGTPIEQTIFGCTDVRAFVTVVKVTGGSEWRGQYLGKVVRYYWSKGGEPLIYHAANEKTGNHKKVSKTEGARPLMTLPDDLPNDIDYERYIKEARSILAQVGAIDAPPPPMKFYKRRVKYLPLVLALLE